MNKNGRNNVDTFIKDGKSEKKPVRKCARAMWTSTIPNMKACKEALHEKGVTQYVLNSTKKNRFLQGS